MANIRQFKYKLIKNFFNGEELNFLQKYVDLRLNREWPQSTWEDQQSPGCPCFFRDEVFSIFQYIKLPLMEKETGLKLLRTYNYWRYYTWGSVLDDHKDRPACEISVTANIKNCGKEYPIHMEGNWINMNPGDAVIYLGCEVEHGRKPFEGDHSAQVFMHYVDLNGPHANEKDDQFQNPNPQEIMDYLY